MQYTTLPSLGDLYAVAETAYRAAIEAGDRATANAINRATLMLSDGLLPRRVGVAWLVPSQRLNEPPYRVHRHGGVWHCGCPSGAVGRVCKHAMLMTLIDEASERDGPVAAAADASLLDTSDWL